MVKPDGTKRKLTSRVTSLLHEKGFTVLSKREKNLSDDEIKTIYKNSFDRDYPLGGNDPRAKKHIEYMKAGTCTALLVRHRKISKPMLYEYGRQVRGDNWLPVYCSNNSIRYILRDTAYDNYNPQYSKDHFLINEVPDNVVHATLSDDEFSNAYKVFFNNLAFQVNYLPRNILELKSYSIDLILTATYSMSSSDKMQIKMHSGISHLQSYLSNFGYRVEIIAFAKETPVEAAKILINTNPRIIGFSTVASELRYVSDISQAIRKMAPDIMLTGGGPHFTLFPQDIMATNLDAICVGEGETALLNLLSGNTLDQTGNWVYRNNDLLLINDTYPFIEDIGTLPPANHVSWDKYPEQKEYMHRRILISRGCPYTCTYCSNQPLSKVSKGVYTRFRSPENIEAEIVQILENFPNVECLFFESEILHPKFADIEGILSVTRKYDSRVYFGTNLRIEVIEKEYLKALRKGGFHFVNIGLESGSEHIRKHVLNRHYKNEDVIRVFKVAKEAGIQINTYNLVGLPEETTVEFRKTIELNELCQPGEAQIAVFFPYPGTDLYYISLDRGYLENPFFHHYFCGKERRTPILNMPNFTQNEIMSCYHEFRRIFG